MKKFMIILIAVAFIAVSVMPAMAEVKFSGRTTMEMWWTKADKVKSGKGFDDTDLAYDIGSISFFRAQFKNGPISARVEIRPTDSVTGAANRGVERMWYGEYDFGGWKFLIGQDYIPGFVGAGNTVQGGQGSRQGSWASGVRDPMLQAKFNVGTGTIRIAAITNKRPAVPTGFPAGNEIDTSIPILEAKYSVKFGPLGLDIGGGYKTYDAVVTATNKAYTVDATNIYGRIVFSSGPFVIRGGYWIGTNNAEYGANTVSGDVQRAYYSAARDGIVDADFTGWTISADFKVNDMFKLRAGYGGIESEQNNATIGLPDNEEENSAYWINAIITVAKNLEINPEFIIRDYKDSVAGGVSTDNGKDKVWGAQFVIRF
ncbi:hypothetical protein ACFL7M_12820 [Thermodesulfobacteriota bacterium]